MWNTRRTRPNIRPRNTPRRSTTAIVPRRPPNRPTPQEEERRLLYTTFILGGGGGDQQTAAAASEFPPQEEQPEQLQEGETPPLQDPHIGLNINQYYATIDLTDTQHEDVYPNRHGLPVGRDNQNLDGYTRTLGGAADVNAGGGGGESGVPRHSHDNDEQVHSDVEGVCAREISAFISQRQQRFIIAETYDARGPVIHDRFLASLQDGQKRLSVPSGYRGEQFYSVAFHDLPDFQHYHCLHLCSWNRSSCRCGRLESWHSFPLISRRAYPISRLDPEGILLVILYHLGGPRVPVFCEIAGKLRRYNCEDRDIRQVPGCGATAAGVVEVPSPPVQSRDLPQHPPSNPSPVLDQRAGEYVGGPAHGGTPSTWDSLRDDATPSTSSEEGAFGLQSQQWTSFLARLNKPKYRPNFLDILTLMKRFMNTPMNALPYNDDWFIHPKITEINHTGLIFDNAIRAYRSEINKLSLSELFAYQTNSGSVPVYSAGSSSLVDQCYWNLDQSLYMLLDLLHYQFSGDWDQVVNFLKLNYYVLEKQSGKKNCLCIIGPASSGKNFWADGLCDFTLNPGKMENPSRSNNFAFASCHNRRVVKWDECNYDRSFDNDVLNLLQGKTFLVNIKYRNMEPVNRTPVIVLGNLYPFSDEQRFKDRVYRVNWMRCERLKRYKKKQPLPLAHGILVLLAAGEIEDSNNKIQKMWNHVFTNNS